MEKGDRGDKPALLAALRDELKADGNEDYLDSVIEYWFSNNYASLVDDRYASPAARKTAQRQRRKKVEEVQAKVQQRIVEKAQMLLLDMELPNGKPLRDCTGRDCAKLGDKMGSWLKKIASQVKPTQKVGDALSEEQVRRLYGK